jgi:ribosomal protein S18 acetylase RimI-like enzyme
MKSDYYVVSASGGKEEEILQAAKLYGDVWREWPWLENQWDSGAVAQEIRAVAEKSDAICFLSKLATEVVAFSWGYFVVQDQLRKISGSTDLDYIFENNVRVFYVSELGVGMAHRREGAGADLTEKVIESAIRQGASMFILRTDIKALPARSLYSKLGFVELSINDQKHQFRTYWLKKVS